MSLDLRQKLIESFMNERNSTYFKANNYKTLFDYYDKKSDCMNINCIIFVNAVYIRKLKIENLLK